MLSTLAHNYMAYPVEEVVPQIKERLASESIVILQAPPGAGKSTVLPLKLLDEPWLNGRKIIMLEPRRLATRSVAHRMASQLNEDAGETIGYRVRFESMTSDKTKCEVVTEGILTRMIQSDNSLDDVGLVIFDEFHERSIHADLSLALCLQVQSILRNDLRILIMSATLDSEKIASVLNAPVISSSGKQYPVSIRYIPSDKELNIAIQTSKAIQKAIREEKGDILVFLPGAVDIHRVMESLDSKSSNISIHPLYGDLSFKKQQEAIMPHPSGMRKVVLATSIAETSLTIEGITVVIDSGYSRVPKFDPRSGLTRLETVRVTHDAADQRTGRAGRLGPGLCYRLWSEALHRTLQPVRQPEILDADLAPTVLELLHWGIKNINDLTWITPPPQGAVSQAKELLKQLGAIDNDTITTQGKLMLELPTHPRIAHLLLESRKNIGLASDVAALLEERDPLSKTSGADLSLRVEQFRKWRSGQRIDGDRGVLERIEKLATSWRRIFKIKPDNSMPALADVGNLLASAYPERIARQIDKHGVRYKLANGRIARLSEHDPLVREPWLVVAQLDSGSTEGKIFLAAPIDEDDLLDRATEHEVITWNSEKGMITAVTEKRIGNALLATRQLPSIPNDVRIKLLCEAVRDEGMKLLGWSDTQNEWQARVMSVRRWRKDEDWPDVSDENLLITTESWLSAFLQDVNKRQDFLRLDLHGILIGLLPWNLSNKLDQLAPARLPVPSGSLIKLKYSVNGDAPVMEVRLQEVFGLQETPTVNEGRNKVLMHLLSPGYKPVQVTQDLKSFWQSAYHEVRKEMRMRYPKHHWPEDPWTAEAIRGPKRKA